MSSSTEGTSDEAAAFSERVKKTFGNLFASLTPTPTPTPSSLSNPLWSLTGGDVEKREWRRDKDTSDRDNNPCASSFDDFFSCARRNSRKSLENYHEEFHDDMQDPLHGDDDGVVKCGLDDWDLRGSIGLDSTLDNEEEEDAFDKIALGRENADGRFYMRDIADSNHSNSISKDELSGGIGSRRRDPRANRSAAKIRLKEDYAEATAGAELHKCSQVSRTNSAKESDSSLELENKVKPILKRKEYDSSSKPSKRVRFDPECLGVGSPSEVKGNLGDENPSETTTQVNESLLDEKVKQVPDYLRNPGKYTCYSLDVADEINNKSNAGACADIFHTVKNPDDTGSRSEQDVAASDIPKSITFVPRKKSELAKADGVDRESTAVRGSEMKNSSVESTVASGFAAEEMQEAEVGDMEVDKPDRVSSSKKQGRQYRTKSQVDEPE